MKREEKKKKVQVIIILCGPSDRFTLIIFYKSIIYLCVNGRTHKLAPSRAEQNSCDKKNKHMEIVFVLILLHLQVTCANQGDKCAKLVRARLIACDVFTCARPRGATR